jgi:phage shock protein A
MSEKMAEQKLVEPIPTADPSAPTNKDTLAKAEQELADLIKRKKQLDKVFITCSNSNLGRVWPRLIAGKGTR